MLASINAVIGSVGEDGILEIAWTVFRKATQAAILTTVAIIFKTIICAMIGYIGPVDSIWKAIIDNPANQELFETLKKDWWKVARFLVDILEPMKRFVSAESTDGSPPATASAWNTYNELDLSQPMNRHAVISQIQRFFKSIIEVFRQADLDIARFDMNTRLETDSTKSIVQTTALQRNKTEMAEKGVSVAESPESWIFVNGIAGEFYWNHLAVQKLQDFFFDVDDTPEDTSNDEAETDDTPDEDEQGDTANSNEKEGEKEKEINASRRTTITGVFNRSDGIFWDLIECAGERRPQPVPNNPQSSSSSNNPNSNPNKATLSSRTASSREAQSRLSQVLRSALLDSASHPNGKDIIMIAHSQGCLLLRLSLQAIHASASPDLRTTMATRLRVFTFGNPAYDWDVHAYTATTEHFANELDYVAKLGVLRRYSSDPSENGNANGNGNELDYCSKCAAGDGEHLMMPRQRVFVNNRRQTGHLFGSQYSLKKGDYDCVNGRGPSWLLGRAFRR